MATANPKPSSAFFPIRRIPNLLGQTFGFLLVLQYVGKNKFNKAIWLCLCKKCGNTAQALANSLNSGHTLSCGCYQKQRAKEAHVIHSNAHSSADKRKQSVEYNSYCAAKSRCNNPNTDRFPQYGGRGIEFHFTSFTEFLAHLGPKPTSQHSIERINRNGHYEVGNVRWAMMDEQIWNKQNTLRLKVDGKEMTVKECFEVFGIIVQTIRSRKRYGWCDTCAATLPKKGQCPHR